MVSPFPGMDPYLEAHDIFQDLHTTLIVAIRAELNPLLPEGYVAATDRHVWIESPKAKRKRRGREPDVYVVEGKRRTPAEPKTATGTLTTPRIVSLPQQERKGKPYLKILDSRERRVVTVLELLSPTNKKPGEHYEQYLAKREEYFAAGVNLVEINLLRAGEHPPLGEMDAEAMQYYILVCRAPQMPRAEIWPFTVRDRVPTFPVPLTPKIEVQFDLKPCLDRSYREARYDEEIDYSEPPEPNFIGEEAAWVRETAIKSRRDD